MNNERIEFALKILAWEVDAARKRISRRRKKLQEGQEIAPHLLHMEYNALSFKNCMRNIKNVVRNIQRIEAKEERNMKWRRGKDPRQHTGRNQMILAYGRKRSS